jgi:hypothetical protein
MHYVNTVLLYYQLQVEKNFIAITCQIIQKKIITKNQESKVELDKIFIPRPIKLSAIV